MMKTFTVGDIVYPVWYPEADTRCKVIAINGESVVARTYDGRLFVEDATDFILEGE